MSGFLSGRTSLTTVQTADLADDAVTEAKVATDAIGLTELKAGTDGELITWDASGDPAAVAVGTATHVLTSNGTGVAPTFQAAAGGSRTLLASATASDDATVDFTSSIDSTYTRYEFHLDRVIPASDDVELTVKLYAASFQATNYNWSQGSLTSSWSNSNASGEVGTFITLGGRAATNIGVGGAAGEGGINGTITLDHPSDASFNTLVYGNGVYEGAGNAVMYWVGAGEWATTTAVTGIQFYFASGNVESGFFRMYGVS